ncbi:unnamed protein product, partial [Nesidiocoris tenuis]
MFRAGRRRPVALRPSRSLTHPLRLILCFCACLRGASRDTTVLLPCPRTEQRNGTGGAEGRTHQPISDASEPPLSTTATARQTFDRERSDV